MVSIHIHRITENINKKIKNVPDYSIIEGIDRM